MIAGRQFFIKEMQLGVINLLHVIEISLVTPLTNAESERVFSFLWRNFSKERSSLKKQDFGKYPHHAWGYRLLR